MLIDYCLWYLLFTYFGLRWFVALIVYVGLLCCFGYLDALCVLVDVFVCLLLLAFGLCLIYFGLGLLYIGLNAVVITYLYYGWISLVWLIVCFALIIVYFCLIFVMLFGMVVLKLVVLGDCLNWLWLAFFCGLVDLFDGWLTCLGYLLVLFVLVYYLLLLAAVADFVCYVLWDYVYCWFLLCCWFRAKFDCCFWFLFVVTYLIISLLVWILMCYLYCMLHCIGIVFWFCDCEFSGWLMV